jgi:hypothetical protein
VSALIATASARKSTLEVVTRFTMSNIMDKTFLLVPLAVGLLLTGCNKNPASSPTKPASGATSSPSASSVNAGPVEDKLKELAGGSAMNCGHLQSQDTNQMDAAAKCAMQASEQKRPFYVAYELPGMTVAIAGNAQGKLFSVNSQSGTSGLASGDCPTSLRVAPSGRVTCFAPGTFPMGMGAGQSAHGSGGMPPAMGTNPHAGSGTLPPGHPGTQPPKGATPPPK